MTLYLRNFRIQCRVLRQNRIHIFKKFHFTWINLISLHLLQCFAWSSLSVNIFLNCNFSMFYFLRCILDGSTITNNTDTVRNIYFWEQRFYFVNKCRELFFYTIIFRISKFQVYKLNMFRIKLVRPSVCRFLKYSLTPI